MTELMEEVLSTLCMPPPAPPELEPGLSPPPPPIRGKLSMLPLSALLDAIVTDLVLQGNAWNLRMLWLMLKVGLCKM